MSERRVVVVTAVLFLALAAPAGAQDGATYGARPAPGPGDRSSGAFNLSIGTGDSISDAVEILNFTTESATFDVYAADVVRASSGGLAPAARDAEITGPAAWVTVGRPTVEVAARGSTLVSFTVKVPPGTPAGDHTAALLVEPRRSGDTDAIASITRVGLWLKVTVNRFEGGVKGETGAPWSFLLIAAALLALALVAWLAYVKRDRRRRGLQDRRDEDTPGQVLD